MKFQRTHAILFAAITSTAGLGASTMYQGIGSCNSGKEDVFDAVIEFGGRRTTWQKVGVREKICLPAWFGTVEDAGPMLVEWSTGDGRRHRLQIIVDTTTPEEQFVSGYTARFDGDKVSIFRQSRKNEVSSRVEIYP